MSSIGRLRQLWKDVDVSDAYPHLRIEKRDFDDIPKFVLKIVEASHFSKRIWFVSASGFFTGAYTIFSTNVIAPAWAYVYWPTATRGDQSLGINIATLVGTCAGMIIFGYLADCFGRKKLYGVELVIVIVATLGLTQASEGYNDSSMSIYPWIVFWRTLLGIGVGAEYPLSALIASEWSATSHRGRMLVAVFMTQPLAQLAAHGVGLLALWSISARHKPPLLHDGTDHDAASRVIDQVWRLVVGLGAVPALLAIIGRLTIPETPRWLLEIEQNPSAALQSTNEVYSGSKPGSTTDVELTMFAESSTNTTKIAQDDHRAQKPDDPSSPLREEIEVSNNNVPQYTEDRDFAEPSHIPTSRIRKDRIKTTGQFSGDSGEANRPNHKESFVQWLQRSSSDIKSFMRGPSGSILVAVSICWFLLDIAYYGLGLDNPQLLGNIWRQKKQEKEEPSSPNPPFDWNSNLLPLPKERNQAIYQVLETNFRHALYTTVPASIVGCFVILLFVNRVPRVRFMVTTFVFLAAIFTVVGSSLFRVYETKDHGVTIVFYAISMFLINVGPNTITFMLPAELFETRNRGTCYGIAAASGKLGAILVQIALWGLGVGGPKKEPLAGVLFFFAPLMLIGALVAWIWIPEVQDPVDNSAASIKQFSSYDNRSLEDIADGPKKGQILGLKKRFVHMLKSAEK
ncbi:unnamed protein product [Periconia digitata]|uniref:Major facilitator superfamily (MFS) profile domain-containing protein n=1 Tax=Periconia digitata TaxID=1303443 RepID=A0A9W4UIU2_9PLEO|nr:unnamed protein product [Periconia digitata]